MALIEKTKTQKWGYSSLTTNTAAKSDFHGRSRGWASWGQRPWTDSNLLLSFALGRDSVFDICTRQVGEGVENVAGLLAGSGPFLGTKRDPL